MAEHTPTTEEVRGAAGDFLCMRHGLEDSEHGRGCPGDQMFDRWLAERDRALRRVTLEEAADALWKVGSSEGELDAVGWLRDRAASADTRPAESTYCVHCAGPCEHPDAGSADG